VGVDKRISKVVPAGKTCAQSGNESTMSIGHASSKHLRASCRPEWSAIVTGKFQVQTSGKSGPQGALDACRQVFPNRLPQYFPGVTILIRKSYGSVSGIQFHRLPKTCWQRRWLRLRIHRVLLSQRRLSADDYLFRERKLEAGTVQQHVAGLRFFYIKTLKRHFLLEDLAMPKRSRRIPEILSPEEVTRLIDSASNLFHRTMLMTLYSTGIRRAELCRLQVNDIDSERMVVHVHKGKGGHDRDVPLSEKLLATLRVYWRWMKPKTYLFPGTVLSHGLGLLH